MATKSPHHSARAMVLARPPHAANRAVFLVLFFTLVLMGTTYLYLIVLTISNVVARERMEREIALSEIRIGALEEQYLAAKDTITETLAAERGFAPLEGKTFVTHRAKAKSVTLND